MFDCNIIRHYRFCNVYLNNNLNNINIKNTITIIKYYNYNYNNENTIIKTIQNIRPILIRTWLFKQIKIIFIFLF